MLKITLLPTLTLLILQSTAQNIGLGTIAPSARLHVADSNVLFTAPSVLPSVGLPPASGAGNRMMWYATKAAVRAGGVTGNHWDEAATGQYSAAFGLSNRAAGDYATSVGWGNSSSGKGSFTAGFSNSATGNYATALGTDADAQAYGSLVIGRYNLLSGSSASWVNTDPLFVIGNGYLYDLGNGTAAIERRNAFSVDKSGNTTIGGKALFNENATFNGESEFKDTARFNGSAGINVPQSTALSTSLTVAGGVTLVRELQTINAANDYMVNVRNKGFIEVSYIESYTLSPTIKLSPGGTRGQIIIINGSGYQFKIASITSPGSAWIAVPATRTINNISTIMLIYDGSRWLELSFSNNQF